MLKAAYQGIEGDASEEAIVRFFHGVEIKPVPCTTLEEVVLKVEDREVEYGFIPVENQNLIKKQNLYKIYDFDHPKKSIEDLKDGRTTFAIFRIKEGY